MPSSSNHISLPDPFTLVIFGASGDLTHRKLMPAVFQLWCQNLLPESFAVFGYARSGHKDESFRQTLFDSIGQSLQCDGKKIDHKTWSSFAEHIFYQQGSYDSEADFLTLGKRIISQAEALGVPVNCLFYLAIPPDTFRPVIQAMGQTSLSQQQDSASWNRIVIEKPFGRDLQTADELNTLVRRVFNEDQIFRIDHYLGKETVQNIMVLRFANSVFEHLWTHDNVDHVQITVSESLGVGRRGRYYDQAGALRDMVQNHMMHLLSLVAMEPPVALTADAIRNEKLKVLQALRPIPPICAINGVVRAQYTTGILDGEEIPGYLQSDNVPPDSRTETFVAFKAYVDNWRWAGVPFYLRTGKCLPKRCTEISVHFNDVPQVLFNLPPAEPLPANVLAIRVQPDEGISLEFQAKVPGPAMNIQPLKMDFDYEKSFGAAPPEAYQRLLLDAVMGDATLFTRSDEVEAAWRFVTPVIEGCCKTCEGQIYQYPAGSWGPQAADELIRADGKEWHLR